MNPSETNPSSRSTAVLNEPFARASNSKIIELDPMRRMWDSLEAAGCEPHGEVHKFRSYCPAHQGENRDALSVSEGADRRVVLRCFRGCDWRTIVTALGLNGRALFPVGHRNAEPKKPRPVKTLSPGAAFLENLTTAGYDWHATVYLQKCPFCDAPAAFLTVHDGGGIDVHCQDGCHYSDVVRAVETRAAIAEAGVEL